MNVLLGLKLRIYEDDILKFVENPHTTFTCSLDDILPLLAVGVELTERLEVEVPSKLTDHTISPEIKESEPLLRIELSDDIIVFIRKNLIQVVYTKDVDCGIILDDKSFATDKINDAVEFINSIK